MIKGVLLYWDTAGVLLREWYDISRCE